VSYDIGPRAAPRPAIGSRSLVIETARILAATMVAYLGVHAFVAQPFEVRQDSMVPTVVDGDYILIDKLSPLWDDYHRGDVIVFFAPDEAGADGVPFVKRIIGLPGDTIRLEAGNVVVVPPGGAPVPLSEPYANGRANTLAAMDGEEWVVPADSYFVLGDNRDYSLDSRAFGAVDRAAVLGRAWLRYFPLDRMGVLAPSGTVHAMTSD
jgi:signal peptidase I